MEKALYSFLGKQKQKPPMYSAIKVNGKKLYEYARKNEQIDLTPREIEIYHIRLLDIKKQEKQIVFYVKCSKGTYIRSLCEDIAKKICTVGYMKELNRTVVGNFDIKDTVTIEELEQNKENEEFIHNHFISIETFFEKKDNQVCLNKKGLQLFLNGVQLTYRLQDGAYRVYNENDKFIGIGVVKNNLLKREIIVENEK